MMMGFLLRVFRPRRRFFVTALLALISYQAKQMSISFFPNIPFSDEAYLNNHLNNLAKINRRSDATSLTPALGRNATTKKTSGNAENMKDSYYVSLQSLSGKLKCWNPKARCEMLQNATTVDGLKQNRVSMLPNYNNSALQEKRTLALVDPALRDGYRNQFMRFVAFTSYALTHGFDHMLLPSIRWKCEHGMAGTSAVPFELLFDVDHWNADTDLPRLVDFDESEHFDWDPFTGLFRGACEVLDAYISRGPGFKHVIYNRSSHFRHPVPYGGGNALGILFYEYVKYDKRRPKLLLSKQNTKVGFLEVEAKITRAMRPTAVIERLIRETLSGNDLPPFLALHARFEPDMLVHAACKHVKVYNLTDVFDMIRELNFANATNRSIFIAVNVNEMMRASQFKWFRKEHQLNMRALQGVMSHGLDLPSGENVTVSVGGHTAFRSDQIDSCAHEIVSSVVSFEIAVQAKIFIGTYVSSWSATVWKARHYMGRGENYAYTPNGLEKIEGVPPPFRC